MAGTPTGGPERLGRGRHAVGEAVGSVALAIYSVTTAVSLAALIFSGPVADGLPRGASTFILGSAVFTAFLAWRSRFDMVFGMVQDTAAIVLVPAVAVVAASSSDDPVRDVVVVLGLSSFLTGLAMWTIGRAGLAGTARYMPTTVVAGFLGGTGWLLSKGGFDVMTDRSLTLGDLDDLVGFDIAKLWLPGAALGVFVAVVPLIRRLSPIVSSIMTIAMTVGFFVIVGVWSSLGAVEDGRWLLGPFPDGGSIRLIGPELVDADWSAVSSTGGSIVVVVILSILGVLLNLSGLQTVLRRRVDLDQELRSAGLVNLLVAPVGGLVGYHALGDTVLANRLGVSRRVVPIAVGLTVSVFAFVGGQLVGYLPRFTAGGLLIGAGLGLLIEWVRGLRSAAWPDRVVSLLIVTTIAFVGILEGIAVGVIAACLIFVVRYSRIDPIRLVSTGSDRRSVVERSAQAAAVLDARADRLVVFELQGYLFFGSVSNVADRIRERLSRSDSPINVVVIDFERVSGVDSSAVAVFGEIADDVAVAGAQLLWSGPSSSAAAQLASVDSIDRDSIIEDRDAAVEAAEDQLLEKFQVDDLDGPAGDATGIAYSAELREFFASELLLAGEIVMEQGERSNALYIVVDGSVSVTRTDRDGQEIRLRTLRTGAIIGEIGFLTDAPRTATVRADSNVSMLVLSRVAHDELRRDRPDLVIELYDRVLRGTADRAAAIHESLNQALR